MRDVDLAVEAVADFRLVRGFEEELERLAQVACSLWGSLIRPWLATHGWA
jgi:hypothetical protein